LKGDAVFWRINTVAQKFWVTTGLYHVFSRSASDWAWQRKCKPTQNKFWLGCYQWCRRRDAGVQTHIQNFDLSKIWEKSLKIREKALNI